MSESDASNNNAPKVRSSFYIILILMPFVILFLLEMVLRIVGFGREVPLFVSEGAPAGYLQPNPNIILRYFPDERMAPNVSPDTVYFEKEKDPDSYRIFIQGGSTAAGFPYGRWGSLQGMLDQRFKRLYPNEKIEVVNTAMAAVNSYTMLDFVDEIIEQDPDLVIIYAGHNEYLGVMGAGSVFAEKGGRSATLLYLSMKEFKIYQLVESLFYWAFTPDIDDENVNRSLMSRVAKGKEIEFGSPIFDLGVTQFSGNLSRILDKYQAAGTPVIIGTLASNEQHQVPFSSIGKVDWDAFDSNAASAANIATLRQNAEKSGLAADWFKLGKVAYLKKDFRQARDAFEKAQDLDALRFRAPSEFNKIIRRQADRNGVFLARSLTAIRLDSDHGIIGDKHMLEHLHPTPRGYFLLAEAFLKTFRSNAEGLSFYYRSENFSQKRAWGDIPITKVAGILGEYKIKKLVSDFPFRPAGDALPVEFKAENFEQAAALARLQGADWIPTQQDLITQYQRSKNIAEAARVAGNLSDALIGNYKAAQLAGNLYRDEGDYPLAIYYQKRAVNYSPKDVKLRLNLAQTFFMAGDNKTSLIWLDSVLEIDPHNKNAKIYKNKLKSTR